MKPQTTIPHLAAPQSTRMLVGINYPWLNYGWDFGESPPGWGTRAAWKRVIEADLDYLRCLGIFAVRWFILGNGTNYPPGQRTADFWDSVRQQWRMNYDPPALTRAFLQDFGDLLNVCWGKSMMLVPVLISRSFFNPGRTVGGVVTGGRADMINDDSQPYPKWKMFFDRVLEPLLDISGHYPETIYAWELINEPELVTRESPFGNQREKTVPQEKMLRFIREGIGRINNRRDRNGRNLFRSTVGFVSSQTVFPGTLQWRGLGVTRHQFHYYAQHQYDPVQRRWLSQRENFPVHTFSRDYPIFIGEFATNASHNPWPQLSSTQNVYDRLSLIERQGYPSAFLWSARACDDAYPPPTDWSRSVHELVRRYTQRPSCQSLTWNSQVQRTYPLCLQSSLPS